MAGISASCAIFAGCSDDTRKNNIENYYLLRVADENGTKAHIIYIDSSIRVCNDSDFCIEGFIRSYSENYYEQGTSSIFKEFSPIQFIPYTDVISKDTYYESNVENTKENLEYISSELESYTFPTNATYTFGDKTYNYTCHVYEIEDKLTNEKRYVLGYPLIVDEESPTQIYDALTASFIYLKINESAKQISSKIDDLDTFTLEEAHAILEEIQTENNGLSKKLVQETY